MAILVTTIPDTYFFRRLSSTRLSLRSWICSVASTRSKRSCTAPSSARIASRTRSRSVARPRGSERGGSKRGASGGCRASPSFFLFRRAREELGVVRTPSEGAKAVGASSGFGVVPSSADTARERRVTSRDTRTVESDAGGAGFFFEPPPKIRSPASAFGVSESFSFPFSSRFARRWTPSRGTRGAVRAAIRERARRRRRRRPSTRRRPLRRR